MGEIEFVLDKTLERIEITKNKLAVESKIRPNTVADLVNGKSKSINFETLIKILDALNELSDEELTIDDIFRYKK